jgi:hypothetical protein
MLSLITLWMITIGVNVFIVWDSDYATKRNVFAFGVLILVLMVLNVTIETPSETVDHFPPLSRVIRDVQAIKTIWGRMSIAIFHTLAFLTVFPELCAVLSPDTLATHREQALWISGFFFYAIITGAKLWNIAVVLTFSFASDMIAMGSWEQVLITPRNGTLLCALLCSMVDLLANDDHNSTAEHCKEYLLLMFTSICLPILWATREAVPHKATPIILCLLCFYYFTKASLHANKNLSERGQIAICMLYGFVFVCASKGPVTVEGVLCWACLICLVFSTNKNRFGNMAIYLFHGFLWTHVAMHVFPYFNGYGGTRNLWIVGFLVLANTRGIAVMNVAVVWGLTIVANFYKCSSAQLPFEPSNWWISLAFICSLIHAYQNRAVDQTDDEKIQEDEVDKAYEYESLPV